MPHLTDRGGPIGCQTHHLQTGLGSEHRGEALAHHRLVVSDQAAGGPRTGRAHAVSPSDSPASPSGRTADTTKPPAGVGPADSVPPSSATRSRIPVRPWPGPRSPPGRTGGPPGAVGPLGVDGPAPGARGAPAGAPG